MNLSLRAVAAILAALFTLAHLKLHLSAGVLSVTIPGAALAIGAVALACAVLAFFIARALLPLAAARHGTT